ncbi:hypothetical protein F5888DRAFT_1886642 [Russula emetica]|nr:hypothetical protein F5888DRAFT_1886642 [Russula emetica]
MSQNVVSSSQSQSQSQPRKGVALITGASRGIGRGIALRLADDGYDIAANGQTSTGPEIEEKGQRALAIPGDVSEESVVKDMIQRTVSTLGSLEVMVANAGIAIIEPLLQTPRGKFMSSVESFDRQMAVNARGTMLCYKHAAERMILQQSGGRIIGACSLAGKQALGNLFGYSATKFAIRALTQSAARALGEYGITVNAYASGGVKSRLCQ